MVRLERLNVVYETDDKVKIEALQAKGFVIVGGAALEEMSGAAQSGAEDIDWNKMTVKELRAYAEKQGIDLDGAERKEEIIAAIEGE